MIAAPTTKPQVKMEKKENKKKKLTDASDKIQQKCWAILAKCVSNSKAAANLSCSVGFRIQFSLGIMAGGILEDVEEFSTERV